jgi:glycosyltransferase involved in cell wall biosynthesis
MLEKGFNAEVLTAWHPEMNETQYENHGAFQIQRFNKRHNLSFGVKFFSHLMKRKYSLLHLHDIEWYVNYLPWMASKLKKTPLVFTSHSPVLMESLLSLQSTRSFKRKALLRNVFLLRDSTECVFIAFTQCQAEFYKTIGIKNIQLIPHGIDPQVFEIERDRTIPDKYGLDYHNLLCVGTIEPRKGQILLVKSLPKILSEFPKTKLLLLGRTYTQDHREYLNSLKFHIAKLNLEHKVVFLDDVPKRDLVQLYLHSSLFVLPTEAEMAPLVFLEAMAAGLPVVSTKKPYLNEILGNCEAGVLVERERKSIEDAILNLLSDKALMRQLGDNGKRIVERKHRLDKITQQYWDLYKSLLG